MKKSWSDYAYALCECGHPRCDHLHYIGRCLHQYCDCKEFKEPN